MCKKYSLIKNFLPVFFLCLATLSAKAQTKETEVTPETTVSLDSVKLCEEAMLIIADTLRYNRMFDDDVYWGEELDLPYPSIYRLPLTFYGKVSPSDFHIKPREKKELPFNISPNEGIEWLIEEARLDSIREWALTKLMAEHPLLIKYDGLILPDAPRKEKVSQVNVKEFLKIDNPVITADGLQVGKPKADRWITRMTSSVQFSQNYVSDNWYQGGESNINILSLQNLNIKRFDETNRTEFETNVSLNAGFYTTPSDTMRAFRVNDNLLQLTSKYGLRAWQHWYYTGAMLFKTQIFNNYKANTNELLSQALSPAEFNLSVGMDYKFENKKKTFKWSVLVAPLSYNLKYVANIKEIDETRFGIDEGDHALNQVGSSFTNQFDWKISKNVQWISRLYVFSNYEHSKGEFENTFNFTINRYFSTRIYTHLRYDDDTDIDDLFQFKEMLSFGFNYVW